MRLELPRSIGTHAVKEFGLSFLKAHTEGSVVELPDEQAKKLIALGLAIRVGTDEEKPKK